MSNRIDLQYLVTQLPAILERLAESTAIIQAMRHEHEDAISESMADKLDEWCANTVVQLALASVAQGDARKTPPVPIPILEMVVCDKPDCDFCAPIRGLIEHERAEGRHAVAADRLFDLLTALRDRADRRQAH